jgi:hypothetical protein
MLKGKKVLILLAALLMLVGCAGSPMVRPVMEENHKVPVGKIEGNEFTGIRYPFTVSVPSHWKMSTEYPAFLEEFGYDKPDPHDKEQNELYLFNPQTKSSIQIDLTPADPYTRFSQEGIEKLTTMATGSLQGELEKDYGKGFRVEVGSTEPIALKGIQYASKKYVTYTVKEVKREQGWIYGFSEPYQIFILFMIVDKDGTGNKDRQDMKTILDSFELMPKK